MRGTIILGRFWGIQVDLDYSWFLIFFLLTWSLAGHYLMTDSAVPAVTRLLMAVLTALLFFASVLAHEFGHALVARRLGVPVPRITLFVFGGMAHMTREPTRARHEFWIAVAGPLTGLLLTGVLALLGGLFQGWGWPALASVAGWLARINLVLALFNLIPGFPLDGGRILRALVWGWTGNLGRATRLAAGVGQAVALGLIAYGLWQLLAGNWVNGLWMAFIGWFLSTAASGSAQQAALEESLRGVRVRQVMMPDCPRVSPELSLEALINQNILTSGRRCFPVLEGGQLAGLITLHQITQVPRDRWSLTPVGQVMIPVSRLYITWPEEELLGAMARMTQENVNQLPVLDNGRFAGILTRENVLNYLQTMAALR